MLARLLAYKHLPPLGAPGTQSKRAGARTTESEAGGGTRPFTLRTEDGIGLEGLAPQTSTVASLPAAASEFWCGQSALPMKLRSSARSWA